MFISENGYEGSDEDYLTPSPSDSAVGDLESIVKVLGETAIMSNCSCLIFLQSYIATGKHSHLGAYSPVQFVSNWLF